MSRSTRSAPGTWARNHVTRGQPPRAPTRLPWAAMAGRKKLSDYERKRSFAKTPEPRGRKRKRGVKGNRFVIQEHHALSLIHI